MTTSCPSFRVNSLSMREVCSGGAASLWELTHPPFTEAHIPKRILQCPAVQREIQFSSDNVIQNLSLRQRLVLCGSIIEEWNFTFGFVIPMSTNSWTTIVEGKNGAMLAPEVLSGNLVIITQFFDDDVELLHIDTVCYYE